MKLQTNVQKLIYLLLLFVTILTTNVVFADTPGITSNLVNRQNSTQTLISPKTDFEHESNDLIANVLYRKPSNLYASMSPNGARNGNILWENNQATKWYIEEQRDAEDSVVAGLIKNDSKAIEAGFKMIDWGFAHQAPDGSFSGTSDDFHSTSFFVQAVAHTLLAIQQSPQSEIYAEQVAKYTPLLHSAARWMILPKVWERGIRRNNPYTHRRYLVAAALGLTGKLTNDSQLIDYASKSIENGLSLQLPDGVNPEKGGYDTSYQMVGIVYAERWLAHFPNHPLTPTVAEMINKALLWQNTRILPTGEISTKGNTRTDGQERGRTGKVKKVSYGSVIRAFSYWASVTDNPKWSFIAWKIANFYYKLT